MRTSASDQAAIQATLAQSTPDHRDTLVEEAYENLAKLRAVFQTNNSLNPNQERLAALAIELICRAESIELGKGAFFRFKRRLGLTTQYFKP